MTGVPEGSQPRFVKVYYATRSRHQRLLKWAAAAFDGFWLGILDPPRLGQLDEVFYKRLKERHDGAAIGYADERYTQRGLAPWETDIVVRHFPPGGRILVTSAGGGREVLALLRAGYDAVGFEPNPELVAAGDRVLTKEGFPGRLHGMPRSRFPEVQGHWAAVLVGWGSYMLIPGRSVRIDFLRAAASCLENGAPLLVSTWLREDEDYDRRVLRVGSGVRRLRRAPPLELGDALASNFVHRFSSAELEDEIRAAGLEPVDSGAEPYGWVVAETRAPLLPIKEERRP